MTLHAFLVMLNSISHLPGQFQAWTGAATDGPKHVLYSGSPLQAFLLALYSHGSVYWGQITSCAAGC